MIRIYIYTITIPQQFCWSVPNAILRPWCHPIHRRSEPSSAETEALEPLDGEDMTLVSRIQLRRLKLVEIWGHAVFPRYVVNTMPLINDLAFLQSMVFQILFLHATPVRSVRSVDPECPPLRPLPFEGQRPDYCKSLKPLQLDAGDIEGGTEGVRGHRDGEDS